MRGIAAIFILQFTLLASSQEVATLTDIKESLYYLIQDYKTLLKRVERIETDRRSGKECPKTRAQKIIEEFIKTQELR